MIFCTNRFIEFRYAVETFFFFLLFHIRKKCNIAKEIWWCLIWWTKWWDVGRGVWWVDYMFYLNYTEQTFWLPKQQYTTSFLTYRYMVIPSIDWMDTGMHVMKNQTLDIDLSNIIHSIHLVFIHIYVFSPFYI